MSEQAHKAEAADKLIWKGPTKRTVEPGPTTKCETCMQNACTVPLAEHIQGDTPDKRLNEHHVKELKCPKCPCVEYVGYDQAQDEIFIEDHRRLHPIPSKGCEDCKVIPRMLRNLERARRGEQPV